LNYYDLTAHEIHELLVKKEVTSVEVTNSVIERAEKTEPYIESYLERTFECAVNTARKVDEKIAKGEDISPLEGVPAALKDNLCTKGVKTTCASKMLENFVPCYDAFVVKKIKEQNSPVLGKLNMDEFAMGSSTETSYFKTTKNPYDINKVPGGSSGGCAAAVCAGSAVYALGSDTGGSIRQPASFCGVVGLKPTYGLVSRFGCVAFASSLDQIGPITRDVTDCANVLNSIVAHDELDSTSLDIPKVDYTKALTGDIRGMKIGIAADYIQDGINEDVKKAFLSAAETFKALGAQVGEYTMKAAKYALPAYYIISGAEASSNLARFDGIRYGYRSKKYEDLTELYKNTRSEGFGAEVKRRILVGTYALSAGYYDAYYKKAQKIRTVIINDFNEQFEKFDFIITPTTLSTAFSIGEKIENPLEMYLNDLCTVSVNIAGLPAISIPCGFDSGGMPIGLHIIGKALSEETILRAAYAFEQNTRFNKKRAIVKNKEGREI
jgi:aspartyl-tRNA(Asn)/glutamyl-tRNA(Gln) amidotransferase subunit A